MIYAVFVYGLLAILRWVLARLAGQLRSSLGLLAKAVPLLAIFALLSFTTEEMWDMFGKMAAFDYFAVIGLFVILGSAFLVVRVPREARRLEREVGADGPPLTRAQRFNVGLVLFVSQAVQVLIVSLTIGAFFVLFGLLAVNGDLRFEWMDTFGDTLVSFSLGGTDFQLTDRAAARRRRPGGVLGLLLRRRDAHRLDLPRGVPRGAHGRDERVVQGAGRVPAPAHVPPLDRHNPAPMTATERR